MNLFVAGGAGRNVRADVTRQSGITLVEVLIVLVMSMVVTAALAGLFAQSVKSRAQVERVGQKIENGRYALDVLAEDIHLAGYYGELDLPKSVAWVAPDKPCSTLVADMGWDAAATPKQVPVAVFGYDGHAGTLPAALTGCLPNYRANTDVLIVRRASTAAFAPSATTMNDIYLQTSSCPSQLRATPFQLAARTNTTATADFPLLNLTCPTDGSTPVASQYASPRKYLVRIYYVATCNLCDGSADDPPTLTVRELDGGGLVTRQVAAGAEDLALEFGVDNVGADGAADVYAASTNVPSVTVPISWPDVVSVRAHVLMRDLAPTPDYVDTRTYRLGGNDITISAAAEKPYKRRVFSSLLRMANVSGRRE